MHVRGALFLLAAMTWPGCMTRAQEYTRTEIGIDSSTLVQNRFIPVTDTGVGARFTYNFTPSLALESEFDSYFTNTEARGIQDGGRATVALMGPKAGIRRDKFGVFFKARAGVMSFSDVFTSRAVFADFSTTRKTHAALDLGIATELYPSARTILRVDAGRMLVRYGNATDFVFPSGVSFETTGKINGPWHFEAGVGYRLGSLRREQETSPAPARFETGIQYSLFSSVRGLNIVRDESGVGGWFTWNFSKYFGLDASSTFFPRTIHVADLQQGGNSFQALAGLRGGIRRGHFGIYGKFRPGIQRYSLTETDEISFGSAPFTDIALDAGGILEYYPSHRGIFRFDAGNTSIHYRGKNIPTPDGVIHAPAFTNNAIQLSVGFGFRF